MTLPSISKTLVKPWQKQKELQEKFVVKLEKDWEKCTLEDLEQSKESITQKLLLPSFSLQLKSFDKGCVSVTWAIHPVFATSLVENIEKIDGSFCKEHKILSMHIDGVELYPSPDSENLLLLVSLAKN